MTTSAVFDRRGLQPNNFALLPATDTNFISFPVFERSESFRPAITVSSTQPYFEGASATFSFLRQVEFPTAANRYFAAIAPSLDEVRTYNTLFSGVTTTDPAYQFKFVNFYRLTLYDFDRFELATYGSRTPASAVPAAVTPIYAGRVEGMLLELSAGFPRFFESTTVVTSAFGAGRLTFTMILPLTRSDGVIVPIEPSGSASITPGANQISGTLVGSGGFDGQFIGNWFGPNVDEIGLVLIAKGTIGGREVRLLASVLGK